MAEWTIYDKSGEERTVAQGVSTVSAKHYVQPDLEYSGTWMGDCFVTLNLRSAYPINFQIGDYVVYRGEKFVMNYDPSVVKKARRGTYGEGFTYDNVKFNALSYELTDMRMLDYVLYDNSVHYSSLPKFSFFCSDVDDLADRLQVNANRYCDDNNITGSDRWIFITPNWERTRQRALASNFPTGPATSDRPTADSIYGFYFPTLSGDYEKVNQNVSIDNMTVWNACKYIKDTFGLNFIVRGRYVVIGAEGIPTEHFFRYGKGNGLYEIERHADEDQAVITKLYAYGSDKNLPTRYYANLNVTCGGKVTTVAKGGLTYNKLDIPYSASFFKTKTEVNDVECYAVRLTYNGTTYDAYVGSADVLEGVEENTTNCSIVFTDGQNIPFGATNTVTFVGGINKDAWPVDHRTQPSGYALPDNMAVGNLMLPGFPTNSLKAWVLSNGGVQNSDGTVTWRGHTAYFSEDQYQPYILSRNADVLGIRESTKFFDGSDGDDEIYPTIEGTEAGVIYAAETIKDNGIFGEGAEVPNFTITLPDFGSGFDLKELLQSDTAIEMKNGYCGGRKFTVKSVKKEDGRWVCTCEREHDTALDLWFPYSYGMSIGNASAIADEPYQVKAGDKYVLTGIEMTDTYVEANAAVLLEAALAFLDKNDYVRYTYVPKIDELFMARQHDGWSRGETSTYGQRSYYLTLKEGDTLLFEDNDLLINGAVYIDTLRIKEYGNGQIPTYEVTLRNDKQVGTVERMQEQINILNNTVVNGTGGGGGGVNVSLVRQLIQTYGAQSFLSKLVDDIANGLITFLKGARYGRFVTGQLAGTGAQIDSRGKIEAQALTLREYLEVPELRFNRAEIIAGNTTQTPCGGIIDTVTVITEGDAETAGTGSATLKLEDGEIGKIAVGDLCMGYWHDMSGGNSETDSDDRHGRMAFSGFKTVYFRITSIPDYDPSGKSNFSDKHYFEYTLRPQGSDAKWQGGNGIHPFPMMHFAGRGNSDNPERQGFTIHTPNYTARLSGVDTWEFTNTNYTYVNGDLTGFGSLIDRNLDGQFGTIDMNLYMKGHIIQVDNTPDELSVSQSMMGLLNKFDTQIVTFKVMDGYRQDHTSLYNYRVSRSSGNPTADAMWASSHGNVGSSWTMSYADLGDADLCEFTVEATATDMPMLSATFLARKNNNLRYFLTLNTDLIHIDMNGEVIGNGDEPTMTTGNDDGGESYLQLNGNYLTTGNSDNVYKIIARAWRVGASNTVIAESIDGLTIRATKYTGSVSESGGTSDSGRLDLDVDFSCDKYIIELIDKNAVGVVYDVKTVLIVRDGSASVIADFDDEMGAGAATSDGTMLAGIPYTSVAHLYRGSAVQDLTNVELVNVNGVEMTNPLPSGWGYREETEEGVTTKTFYLPDSEDLALKGKDITVSLSYSEGGQDATLTLSKLSKESPDNNKFGVRLTAGSEANTAYFYFNKFKAGSDGHVTLYQLAPDTTAIKVNKNGQYSTSTVTVGVLKIDVDETGQTETSLSYSDFGALGLSVYHKVDGQPSGWSDYEGSISVGSATTNVELKLEQTKNNETIEWDTETIPVVKDGLDSNYIMRFSTYKHDIWKDPEDHSKGLADDWDTEFSPGTNWAIMSSDGGTSWNGPYPIVGEEGAPGGYTEFSFGVSQYSIVTNTDADGCPDDLPAAGEEATQYGWSDGIIAVTTERPYLWMRTGKFVWNSALQSHTQQGSYTYARVKGLDAPDRYELELTNTSFQVDSNGNTFTPSEIKVQAVAVKANGSKDYKETSEYQNSLVRVSMVFIATDDTSTSSTVSYGNLSFDGSTAIRIKQTLINLNKDITALKSVTLTFDFYKNASDSTAIGTATTTIPIMRNGRDGAIVTIADFDDEMISIPVKSDGSQVRSWSWQTTAHLWYGNEALALDTTRTEVESHVGLELQDGLQFSNDHKSVTVTVTGFYGQNNIDNCKLTLRLVSADGNSSGIATAYVNKIPSGEGSDAVYYNLVVSENAVHATSGDVVTSSQTITINAYKHVGDETPELANDGNTIIQVYGSNNAQTPIGSSTSGAYTLNVASPNTLSNYKVYLNLYDPNGGTIGLLLDQETIPVLRDGRDGAVAVIADFDDEMISIPVQSDGSNAVWPSGGWTTAARLYRGTEQLALDDTHISAIQAPDANECGLVDYAGLTVETNMTYAADKKSVSVTIKGFNTDDITNRKFVMQLTDASHQYTATCIGYVNKIPAGEGGSGKDAVLYQLALSQNVIHTDADARLTSSGSVTAYVYKYKGEDAPALVTDQSIWIRIESVGSASYGNAVLPQTGVLPSVGYVVFSAPSECHNEKYIVSIYPVKKNTTPAEPDTVRLLDQETIPVLRDGKKGDPGDTGNSVTLYYSQYIDKTPLDNWHATFTSNDIYAREVEIGSDGTTVVSWGEPFRIVGEQGIQGPDGKPGDYTDYSFGRSAQSTTTDSSTAPVIDGSWSDGVPVPSTAYPYIWMRKRLMTWNATRSQYVEVANTTRYIRVTGEKGDKGEDGKDAAAYDFIRFSDDARLVNGVWTGTFTGKSDAAIEEEVIRRGDKCNLLPNTNFAEWNSSYGQPYGWSKNGNASFSYTDEDGVRWLTFNGRDGNNYDGAAQSVEQDSNGPKYLTPYDYASTYTISVKYKGTGQVMIGVQYYRWDNSTKQLSFVNDYQEWEYYGAEIADDNEHLLTFTFVASEDSATHLRVLLIHRYGTSAESSPYIYRFAQPKIEKGSTATEYSLHPAYDPAMNGTVQGLWRGVLRWGNFYPSSVFSDYSWSRVRDAEPRMTNWVSITASQQPNYNSEDSLTEQTTFFAGAYGEKYYDMVYDGTDYWLCKKSYEWNKQITVSEDGTSVQKSITPSERSIWTVYWEKADQYNFLMARTLFASRAYINQLGVEKLSTISQNGQVQVHDGVMEVFNAAGLVNIRFGLDANGYAVMQYYDNDGTLLYDLGPNGIASTELRQASVTRGTWYKLVEGTEFTNVLTQENIRRLFSTGITADTNYYYFLCKIVAGRKCADTATDDQGYISNDDQATSCDEHYFAKLESSSPKIRPQNYLPAGIYYNPTLTSFMRGGNGCRIRTFGGYGTPDAQYSNYASHYQAAGYAVTWPTSADDIMRNPLLYVEVYIVSGGKVSKTMKVFMRYDVYSNDDNITK